MIEPADWGQLLLDSPADGVVATDRAGTILHWGAGAGRIFGYSAEDAVGQSLDLIVPERQRSRHWEGFRRVMETGSTRYGAGDIMAVPALTRDGRQISIEFTLLVTHDDRGVTGTLAVIRDVTERFEELRRLRRALGAPQVERPRT